MEELTKACAGCGQRAFALSVVDGSALCDRCAATSVQIDRQLARVRSDDPVSCDGCADPVDFDARVAVVTRECGGAIFCDHCKAAVVERAPS